jgi:hypothetical protein
MANPDYSPGGLLEQLQNLSNPYGPADTSQKDYNEPDVAMEDNTQVRQPSKPSQNARLKKKLDEKQKIIQELEYQLYNEKAKRVDREEKYTDLLSTNIHWAKTAAERENDLSSKTEAEKYISDLQTQKLQTLREKEQLANYQPMYSESVADPEAKSNYEEFLERNPIVNLNDPNNPNYSPEAFKIMENLSSKLSVRYKMEGRGEDEFSPTYFKDLENMFKNELGYQTSPQSSGQRSRNISTPVSSSRAPHPRGGSQEPQFGEVELKVIQSFLDHAQDDTHKEAIKKRYIEAKKRNYIDQNINLPVYSTEF